MSTRGLFANPAVICSKTNSMRQASSILTLLIVSILLNSCFFVNKFNDKRLPDGSTRAEEISQAPAVKPKAPVKAPEEEVAKPKPSVGASKQTNPSAQKIAYKPIVSPLREFRAAWIATVANINWPSKPGLSTEEQKSEALSILNYLQENKFNAVIFQVRPQADALYKSDIEPWSYFLTGQQDRAPFPFYDPLTFWIEEAHKRGMELHAWLNPYRAHHTTGKEISSRSVVRTNPERVYLLKEGYWWMDPALKATQDHTSRVVMDIVKRYDVDGIHFDDYFYPYPSYNGDKDFPDDKSWNAYVNSGGKLSRGDWRRDGVNKLIERLYAEIKHEKKHVKFGLSPFGIWRPGFPSTVTGFDQYEKLYADAKLWLNRGWIDYFTPQLYWPINKQGQAFPDLLGWWQSENTLQRHLWPGISIGTNKNGVTNNKEVLDEINLTRSMLPKSMGAVHWSVSSLTKNPTLTKELSAGLYNIPALVPASPWLDNIAPGSPQVTMNKSKDKLNIQWSSKDKDATSWILYSQYDNKWEYTIMGKAQLNASLQLLTADLSGKTYTLKNIMVTAVDRTGNESEQQVIPVN